MSSDSEGEDFLSADEGGSDFENIDDNGNPIKKSDLKSNDKVSINLKEKDTTSDEKIKKDSEKSSPLKVLENVHEIPGKSSDETLVSSSENNPQASVESVITSLSIEEKEPTKPENITEKDLSNSLPPIEQNKLDEEQAQSLPNTVQDKQIKPSKIGLKKPREKLGDRLGNKKLGSRIPKDLQGISSTSYHQREENQSVSKTETEPAKNTEKIISTEQKTSTESNIPTEPAKNTENNTSTEPEKNNEKYISTEPSETHEHLTNIDDKTNDGHSSWSSWGDWGSTLMTAASSFTKEVSQGVGTVLESVENTIGAPNPEELAKQIVLEERNQLSEACGESKEDEKLQESHSQDIKVDSEPTSGLGLSAFGSLLSEVSGAFEMASNKVLMGGLDTLEKIGRRTMDIIQDGDPGLRKKRAFLKPKNTNLSMVLREARERAIEENSENRSSGADKEKGPNQIYLATFWNHTKGPIHFEALSLVAKQCQEKTYSYTKDLSPHAREELQKKIQEIKNFASLEDDERLEFDEAAMSTITRDIQLPLQFQKIITGWSTLQEALQQLSLLIVVVSDVEMTYIHEEVYKTMTTFMAAVVGLCHKAAEVALVTPDLDAIKLAEQFQRLCGCISSGLEKLTDDISETVSKFYPTDEANDGITSMYVQVAELNSFLENSLIYLNSVIVQAQVMMFVDE